MILKCVKMDIMTIDLSKEYIAHCISGDFTLGAGLAKKLNEKYRLTDKLNTIYQYKNGQYCAFLVDHIFNLVTKDEWKERASYENLRKSLEDLKINMFYMDIKEIYMPKLGCGKDKLDWSVVEALLNEVFNDMNITIYVCSL